MRPRLSIIITKNEQKRLPRLLRSIKEQDFKDYEIIVSDAASTDRTRAIAKKYGCRVVDGGLPAAGRNRGATVAKAKLLLFLDADGMLSHGFLRDNVREFEERRLDCATTGYVPISFRPVDRTLFSFVNAFCKSAQYVHPCGGGCSLFCTKRKWREVRGFPEDFMLSEDHEFLDRIARSGGRFRVLNSRAIYVDVRRLDNEGRFNIVKKYVKGAATMVISSDKRRPSFDYVLQGHTKSVTQLYDEASKKMK